MRKKEQTKEKGHYQAHGTAFQKAPDININYSPSTVTET